MPVPFIDVSLRRMSARVCVLVVPSNGNSPARPSLEIATTCTAVGKAGVLSGAAGAGG